MSGFSKSDRTKEYERLFGMQTLESNSSYQYS
ncbi:hypothetical protein T01_6716 [Trichinella spiralis]|uniref:Uncharacterized protein n=1 Tax=Trichinella spiralis TaxID=6334 RepID=A0A0V0YZD4_TRISP|nr:hypothetical protein T01_9728 [Trichinella spiralis]KRY05569.1 hypothetical protein T01_6716 [Trichinella spiralis]